MAVLFWSVLSIEECYAEYVVRFIVQERERRERRERRG